MQLTHYKNIHVDVFSVCYNKIKKQPLYLHTYRLQIIC